MPGSIWKWVLFNVFVLAMLALDLGVVHRRKHEIKFKEAVAWSGVWIGLALAFAALVACQRGAGTALQFLTGFIIEESLSVDNLFVFLLIFSYFAVPARLQHGVLFWGVLGAMVLRAIFIVAGVALLERFEAVIYLFGAILIFSGVKMALEKENYNGPKQNPGLKFFPKADAGAEGIGGSKSLVRRDGRTFATP